MVARKGFFGPIQTRKGRGAGFFSGTSAARKAGQYSVSFHAKGASELIQRISAIDQSMVRRFAGSLAEALQAQARELTPIRTGLLRMGWGVRWTPSGANLFNNVRYAGVARRGKVVRAVGKAANALVQQQLNALVGSIMRG